MGILSGLGAYEGSKKERKGYKDAAKVLESLKPEIEKAHKMMDPWNQYRGGYADQLNRILQGEEDWTTDPGYQFRVAEDTRATERAAAARGSNISGNVLTELASRRQEMASQEYGNVISRLIGLSAATPENAMAGGQMYANAMTSIFQGQAEAEIGAGFAQSRGKAALATGIEDTAYSLMNYFIPGGNFGQGDSGVGGQSASWGTGQSSITSGGGAGTNLTGWGANQGGMGGSNFGAVGGGGGGGQAASGFGSMGTNLTGWGANQGGMGGSNFGNVGGATSSFGSFW